jgi:hypothetical protein
MLRYESSRYQCTDAGLQQLVHVLSDMAVYSIAMWYSLLPFRLHVTLGGTSVILVTLLYKVN